MEAGQKLYERERWSQPLLPVAFDAAENLDGTTLTQGPYGGRVFEI